MDFLSAYSILQEGNDPMASNGSQVLTGVGLLLLGTAVIATGIVMFLPLMSGRMRLVGALMELYGIIMGFMSSYTTAMNPAVADGMLVIGILMFVNGILMQSRGKKMPV